MVVVGDLVYIQIPQKYRNYRGIYGIKVTDIINNYEGEVFEVYSVEYNQTMIGSWESLITFERREFIPVNFVVRLRNDPAMYAWPDYLIHKIQKLAEWEV